MPPWTLLIGEQETQDTGQQWQIVSSGALVHPVPCAVPTMSVLASQRNRPERVEEQVPWEDGPRAATGGHGRHLPRGPGGRLPAEPLASWAASALPLRTVSYWVRVTRATNGHSYFRSVDEGCYMHTIPNWCSIKHLSASPPTRGQESERSHARCPGAWPRADLGLRLRSGHLTVAGTLGRPTIVRGARLLEEQRRCAERPT